MDANHLRIDALLGMNDVVRTDLRVRGRASRPEAWVELQSERVPPPGMLNLLQRRHWNRLITIGAERVGSWIAGDAHAAPRELEGWLLPVWRGDNDVDRVVDEAWRPAAVLLADQNEGFADSADSAESADSEDRDGSDELFIDEMLPEAWKDGLPAAFRVRWMRQPVLRLVAGSDVVHSKTVETAGSYGLVRIPIDTLVAVIDIRPLEIGSAPTTPLPGYTERLVPVEGLFAIEALTGLRDGLQRRLDALVQP